MQNPRKLEGVMPDHHEFLPTLNLSLGKFYHGLFYMYMRCGFCSSSKLACVGICVRGIDSPELMCVCCVLDIVWTRMYVRKIGVQTRIVVVCV